MWVDSWSSLGRLLVVGVLSYLALLVMLRMSGARTLAKLNAFDFVVTIALGSVLVSAFVTSGLPLATAVAALAALVGLQWLVATATRRTGIRQSITATPVLLVVDGVIRDEAAAGARVTDEEIHQAIRSQGQGDLDGVAAAVLETDGTISVITHEQAGRGRSLAPVPGWSERADPHRGGPA